MTNRSRNAAALPADLTVTRIRTALRQNYAAWNACVTAARMRDVELDPVVVDFVCSLFEPFTTIRDASLERARKLVLAVDRGKSLVAAALEWSSPTIGPANNVTARARGQQWRLVLAWSGLEQIIDATAEDRRAGAIDRFQHSCPLPAFETFPGPANTAALARWRNDTTRDLMEFLAPNRQSRPILENWLLRGKPVPHRLDALILAQSLRHAIAHGALSPNKVSQWGLQPFLDRLTLEVGQVTAVMIGLLAQRCKDCIRTELHAAETTAEES